MKERIIYRTETEIQLGLEPRVWKTRVQVLAGTQFLFLPFIMLHVCFTNHEPTMTNNIPARMCIMGGNFE